MSPGMGPIINCCSGDHLGSGKGSEDLNFHLCSLHLFILYASAFLFSSPVVDLIINCFCSEDDPGPGRGQLDLDLYFLLMSSLNLRIGLKFSALSVMCLFLFLSWVSGDLDLPPDIRTGVVDPLGDCDLRGDLACRLRDPEHLKGDFAYLLRGTVSLKGDFAHLCGKLRLGDLERFLSRFLLNRSGAS